MGKFGSVCAAGGAVFCERELCMNLRGVYEAMNYKIVIFDLDGTILNTLTDLACSVNFALESCGFSRRTEEEVRSFLGNGLLVLMEKSLPKGASEEEKQRAVSLFNDYYAIHCNDTTGAYRGITETVYRIRQKGICTAVVSNKPDYAVKTLCREHFDGLFDYVTGVTDSVRRKPWPDSVNDVLRKGGFTAEHAVYIGDSEVDIETAENAGIDCISVDWGFRDRSFLEGQKASVIISKPEELLELILGKDESI